MIIETLIFIGILILIFFFLGLCIMIHELGHLLCALWRGLHVDRFSIGFGKRIWGFTHKGVEYQISLLPFGGFVALPQLEPGNEPKTADGRPLPVARPRDRVITALAGPAANVALGFLLGTVVWAAGVDRPKEMEQFEVISVQEYIEDDEGNKTPTPEYKAGLRPGDRIIKVNNEEISGAWDDLVHKVALATGEIELTVLRNDDVKDISYRLKGNPEWEGLGYPFFEVSMPVIVQRVEPDSPAARADIKAGDRIKTVNEEPVHNAQMFVRKVSETKGAPFSMSVEREGREVVIEGIAGERRELDEDERYLIGVQPGLPTERRHLTPWWQFTNVLTTTRDTLGALISPDSLVGPRHMSGPVGIIQMNYLTMRHQGWRQGLFFVVFVSFSLAIFNLLPIPVLDGGHIVIGGLEMTVRRRMPEKLAWTIQAAFAILLISFMLYVTFHDLGRLGRSFGGSEEESEPVPATEETNQLE